MGSRWRSPFLSFRTVDGIVHLTGIDDNCRLNKYGNWETGRRAACSGDGAFHFEPPPKGTLKLLTELPVTCLECLAVNPYAG